MNYNETLDYLYSQAPEYQRIGHAAYKEGLDNSLALDEIFGHPHKKFKNIHVGGTNGKGSVSNLLAAILQMSGYRVGLYTSPHLIDFRERIRVNGEMINKEYVIEFVEKYRDKFEPVMASFFELTMEMAFLYFAEKKVDVAIIEVGLGGRLDSTNIIFPDLSIITNIGLDHMNYLGNTLTKIAAEKAGIIKKYTPVIIGEIGNSDVAQVFIDKAKSVEAPIVFSEVYMSDFVADRLRDKFFYKSANFDNITGQLSGPAQEYNARTVLTAVDILLELGYNIPKDAVYKGFEKVTEITGLMGRWQLLKTEPKIFCDIAHNSHGIKYVIERLLSEEFKRLHIVFGMANDKDTESVLRLLPKNANYYFTKASVQRALDETKLADMAGEFGLQGYICPTVSEAVIKAIKNADKEDIIFIGGSSFIVADALPMFI
jgi:dihydrofolate synthase/folylpolyglutamate synthase